MLEIPFINKKLFVVTDIHGNLQDFNDYLNLWLMDKSNHIVFTGDLIHHDEKSKDKSLEILDLVRVYNRYSTFHVLLGNHELSQLLGENVYRYHINQCDQFRELVEEKYPNNPTVKYNEYKNIIRGFDYYVGTSNGLLISHTGFHEDYIEYIINDSIDIDNINLNNSFERKIITEHLWARPYDDYTEQTINQILNYTNKKYLISGHTNYNGCHIIGNQLIFDSSHNTETKYYLEIQLNKKYENIIEILKQLNKKK